MDFPFLVKPGSIPVSAIGMAVITNGRGAAVGIFFLSHREAEICVEVIYPSPMHGSFV